jgi:periplasmic protein TonB
MAFDSSTLCARTTAGDAELATPRQGLSLGQRRVLTLLQQPAAVDELAQQHRLDPEKLARDLTRLAELRLILLQGPAMQSDPATVGSATPTRATESMAPVVLGHTKRRAPMLPLAAAASACLLAAGVWYGTRPGESTISTLKPQAATSAGQPAATTPSPAPPIAHIAIDVAPVGSERVVTMRSDAMPATALVLRGGAVEREARPELRPGLLGAAPVGPKPVAAPNLPETTPAPRPESPGTASALAPTPIAPVATSTPAPAIAPISGPTTPADTQPPVQLAAAAPSEIAPRPAVAAELKAISRDPPDFPKEAIADGLKSGIVSARIHVDARGNVSGVDILESQPPRVFDRAVRKALLRWQFEPSAASHTADVDIKFQRD